LDISVPHLVRTVRRFVDEEERGGKGSPAPRRPVSDSFLTKERHPESAAAEEVKPKAVVTYQVSERPSSRVQKEEFAKQLRLARYLAAGGSPPSRPMETVRQPRTPKQERPIAKASGKTKAAIAGKKARDEEVAKERRRAGRRVSGRRQQALIGVRSNGLCLIVKPDHRTTEEGTKDLVPHLTSLDNGYLR
jgi:hypothetical protein